MDRWRYIILTFDEIGKWVASAAIERAVHEAVKNPLKSMGGVIVIGVIGFQYHVI